MDTLQSWIQEAMGRGYRRIKIKIKPGWDLVWIARPSIAQADFGLVSAAVDQALHRGKLYASTLSTGVETSARQSRIMNVGEASPDES